MIGKDPTKFCDIQDYIEKSSGEIGMQNEKGKLGNKSHPKSVVIGFEGTSEGNDQIVLAAGKENQLRFNADGGIFHNYNYIGESQDIVLVLADIVATIASRLRDIRFEEESKVSPALEVARAINKAGFINAVACIVMICESVAEDFPFCAGLKDVIEQEFEKNDQYYAYLNKCITAMKIAGFEFSLART